MGLVCGSFLGFNLVVWKKQLAYATTRDVQVRKEGWREGGREGGTEERSKLPRPT